MAIYNKKAAAAARARMAKRGKRERFLKQNKKRIIIIIVLAIILLGVAIMTPWGPNWYWQKVQETKMEGRGRVRPGAIREFYNLAIFYVYTMRQDDALKVFDEIGNLYFGVPLSKYGVSPDVYYDQRMDAIEKKENGQTVGPPFDIDPSDAAYVGKAIYRTGLILDSRGGRQFTYNMNKDLFVNVLEANFPNNLDPSTTGLIHDQIDRYEGRK